MFGFLKKKIKEVSNKVAEEIEEDKEISEEITEDQLSEDEKQEIEKEKKGFFSKLFSKKKKKEEVEDEDSEEDLDEETTEEDVDTDDEAIEEKEQEIKEEQTQKETISAETIEEPVKEEKEPETEEKQARIKEEQVEENQEKETEVQEEAFQEEPKEEVKEEVPQEEKEEEIIEESTPTKEEIESEPEVQEEPNEEQQIEEESNLEKETEEEPQEEKKEEQTQKETIPEETEPETVKEVVEEEPEIKTLPKKHVPEDEVHITYFVHGTTTDNEKSIPSGHKDVELSELGIQQSKELTKQLKYEFDVILTSDLLRATSSADLTWPDREKIKDKRLRECDYGKLNGQPKPEHKKWKETHNPIYDHYPGGESYNDVTSRIRKFLNDLYKKYKGKHIAIVAHRYPQLAMEVLLNHKSWTQVLNEDWRLRKEWQPGWEYKITEKVEKHKEKKKDFIKDKDAEIPEPEAPHLEEAQEKLEQVKDEVEKKKTKIEDPTKKKKGIFTQLSEHITKLKITDEKFDELFWDLEVALLENNVAMEVIEKIKENLKAELKETKVTKRSISEIILNNLQNTIESLFDIESIDLLEKIKTNTEKPFKILFLGVNGSGKTTTLAKIVQLLKDNDLSSVIAASDTFRAAAIQQLEEHATNLNTKMIKHDYGADPAAVAYDAIEHAKSKNLDVVLIDTAGRLHSNSNLMDELHKIIRVAKPNLKIFIGESITGNDCVEQATQFNEAIGIDAIILTKADIDEKGGAAISISYVTGKPILYLTTGQEYKDLKKFESEDIVNSIFNE